MSMLSYVIQNVNTICIRLLNIQIPPHIKYNDINMCFSNEFKPVKPEKTVISIRLDADVLKFLTHFRMILTSAVMSLLYSALIMLLKIFINKPMQYFLVRPILLSNSSLKVIYIKEFSAKI